MTRSGRYAKPVKSEVASVAEESQPPESPSVASSSGSLGSISGHSGLFSSSSGSSSSAFGSTIPANSIGGSAAVVANGTNGGGTAAGTAAQNNSSSAFRRLNSTGGPMSSVPSEAPSAPVLDAPSSTSVFGSSASSSSMPANFGSLSNPAGSAGNGNAGVQNSLIGTTLPPVGVPTASSASGASHGKGTRGSYKASNAASVPSASAGATNENSSNTSSVYAIPAGAHGSILAPSSASSSSSSSLQHQLQQQQYQQPQHPLAPRIEWRHGRTGAYQDHVDERVYVAYTHVVRVIWSMPIPMPVSVKLELVDATTRAPANIPFHDPSLAAGGSSTPTSGGGGGSNGAPSTSRIVRASVGDSVVEFQRFQIVKRTAGEGRKIMFRVTVTPENGTSNEQIIEYSSPFDVAARKPVQNESRNKREMRARKRMLRENGRSGKSDEDGEFANNNSHHNNNDGSEEDGDGGRNEDDVHRGGSQGGISSQGPGSLSQALGGFSQPLIPELPVGISQSHLDPKHLLRSIHSSQPQQSSGGFHSYGTSSSKISRVQDGDSVFSSSRFPFSQQGASQDIDASQHYALMVPPALVPCSESAVQASVVSADQSSQTDA
eukprot:ANDGO_04241.mRNA.1 hypothetical protein